MTKWTKEYTAAYMKKRRDNPDFKKKAAIASHTHYIQNIEKYSKLAKAYYLANTEKLQLYQLEYQKAKKLKKTKLLLEKKRNNN
jgi:hypothetical protein